MHNVFFSITIPIYNAEKYINRCIQSIVEQTCDDYELILVDDESNDSSLEMCYKWKKTYPDTIRIISKNNTGSLLTRRVCLEKAKGKFIYIIDADDYLCNKNALQIIKDTIMTFKCDMVFFNATSHDKTEPFFKYNYKNLETFEGEKLKLVYENLILGDSFNALWSKVFSRNLVDWDVDYKKYFDVRNGTDLFQTIPIVFNAKKIVYIDEILYYYQLDNNETSIIHNFNTKIFFSLREGFFRLYDKVKESEIDLSEFDNMLKMKYMKIVCTAAYKVRLIKKEDIKCGYEYLKEIGEDVFFRDIYKDVNIRNLGWCRAFIVKTLYIRKYKLLLLLIRIYYKFYLKYVK